MKSKKHWCRAIIMLIAILLIISAVLSFCWLTRDTYSLEINPDEIYRITWGSATVGQHEVNERDELQRIVNHMNAWTLRIWQPVDWVDTYPLLRIQLYDEEGNSIGNWTLCRTRALICIDPNLDGGSHQIVLNFFAQERFVRRFG